MEREWLNLKCNPDYIESKKRCVLVQIEAIVLGRSQAKQ